FVGYQYRNLLYWIIAGSSQLYNNYLEYANARHVADAHAIDMLVVVYDCNFGVVIISSSARCGIAAVAGQKRGNQLLHSQHLGHRKPATARGRLAYIVAASFLVFWSSGSLHCDSARYGFDVTGTFNLRQKTSLWLSRDGLCDSGNWSVGILRVGSSHVHQRNEPYDGFGLLADHVDDRCAIGNQDL